MWHHAQPSKPDLLELGTILGPEGQGQKTQDQKSLSPKSSGSDPQAMLLSHNGHFLTGDPPRVCRDENLPSLAQLEHPIIMVLEQCHYIRRSLSGGC